MSLTQKRTGALATALVAAVALFALLTSTSEAKATAKGGSKKPTVVLVHGAWADASGYSQVIANLQKQGYPAIAPANPRAA